MQVVANDWITPIKPMPSGDRKIMVSHPKTKALLFEFSSDKLLSGGETKENTMSISLKVARFSVVLPKRGR